MELNSLFLILDFLGTFVFAITGALAGSRKKMDIFGMLVLAVATATGGGMLRSIISGDLPVDFLNDGRYILICALATLIVYFYKVSLSKFEGVIKFFDAMGLGIFFGLGMAITRSLGFENWSSILLGVISATFGGVIRDTLSAEVPLIFRKELYASLCVIGGLTYLLFIKIGLQENITIITVIFFVFILRLLSIKYKLSLPRSI